MLPKLRTFIETNRDLAAFLIGILVVSFAYAVYDTLFEAKSATETEEVHVHSDFLMYLNGKEIDLTADRYQSEAAHVLADDFHFHDNNDEVLHRHADDLTLAFFLSSLGYKLTESCLTTDANAIYCTNVDKVLRLYVNREKLTDITKYIPQEGDQILLYYGKPEDPAIEEHLNKVTDDACIYSGTCPERGLPPPESCGLTCEL